MKAFVDSEKCIGCGLCVQIAPEVYKMQDDKAIVIIDEIPENFQDSAREGSDQCPVIAIEIS